MFKFMLSANDKWVLVFRVTVDRFDGYNADAGIVKMTTWVSFADWLRWHYSEIGTDVYEWWFKRPSLAILDWLLLGPIARFRNWSYRFGRKTRKWQWRQA